LTGACLWASQIIGWSIKGVICEYAYWDKEAQEKIEYSEGEFEKLFAEKTKIRLFYKEGINPLEIATLPALIQHLEEMEGCALRFVNIHEDSGGAVVELAIENIDSQSPEEVKHLQAALETEAQRSIEYQQQFLSEKETRLQLEGRLAELRSWFSQQQLLLAGRKKGDKIMGNKYDNKGQVGAMGDNAHAHDMTFNQTVNNTGESLDLVALASELTQLRMAIRNKQDSSPQADVAIGEIAKAEIAAGDQDESGVWQHMKAAGRYALDTATTIGTTLAAEAIKKSMGM
jgi:hypothetical protein